MPVWPAKDKVQKRWVEDSGSLGFGYWISLSRRRSMSMRVDGGQVSVGAPLRTSLKQIREWVESKQAWVRKKIAEQSLQLAEVPKRRYCEGESWPYLGEERILRLALGPRANCFGDEAHVTLVMSRRSKKPQEEQAAELMSLWYRQQAQVYLEKQSALFSEQLGVRVTQVKLRLTRSKWGHCTPQGVLQFNWLIMQAPKSVVDYLVAHEVSHLVHLNHSAAFWRVVESICPDYQAAERWLKNNGHKLVF